MYIESLTALIIQIEAQQVLLANHSLLENIFAYSILIFVIFMSFIFPLFFIVPMIKNRRKNRRVLRHGEPVRAKILKIRETGVSVNDPPQIGFLLAVYPENIILFKLKLKKSFPFRTFGKSKRARR